MRITSALSKIGLAAAILLTVDQGFAQDLPPIRSLPLADAKVNGGPENAEGHVWLHWSADHQLGYVQGWADGSYWGYFDACTQAQIIAPSLPQLEDECMVHIPTSHLTSQEYSAKVTEFYAKYPEDRALPIRRVLRKFLEAGMTSDGVHRWLNELITSVQRSFAK